MPAGSDQDVIGTGSSGGNEVIKGHEMMAATVTTAAMVLQEAAATLDEETGTRVRIRQSLEIKGGSNPGDRSRPLAKLKQDLKLSFFIMTAAVVTLVNLFFIRRDAKGFFKNPSLTFAAFFAFMSLISAIGLMFHTMKMMTLKPQLIPANHPACSKFLLYVSATFLFLTIVAIILSLLPKSYCFLPAVLLPMLLVTIFHFCVHPATDDQDNDPEAHNSDESHKADRKRSVQLLLSMSSFSFVGFLGTLLGYHKHSSNQANHSDSLALISIYFMLGATITGFVTLLLPQVLPMKRQLRNAQWMMYAIANIVMLSLLVPAVIMIATIFLKGYVVLTFSPVIIAAVLWSFLNFCTHDTDATDQEAECIKQMYTISITVMSVSFGMIMGLFTGFLGAGADENHLKVCMFIAVSDFISAVTLGFLTFRPPSKMSLGMAAMVLACCVLALLVLAALALLSLIGP